MLTATSALFLLAPVANAFGCGESNTATSGMPMPAWPERSFTVSSSQRSACPRGSVITCARVDIFAIFFESSSEMNEPPMPNTAANTSIPVRLMPTPCWYRY